MGPIMNGPRGPIGPIIMGPTMYKNADKIFMISLKFLHATDTLLPNQISQLNVKHV